jgi:hypothetical protein
MRLFAFLSCFSTIPPPLWYHIAVVAVSIAVVAVFFRKASLAWDPPPGKWALLLTQPIYIKSSQINAFAA